MSKHCAALHFTIRHSANNEVYGDRILKAKREYVILCQNNKNRPATSQSSNFTCEKMQSVLVLAYEFPILGGLKYEIHTEIRVYGNDYWFEINGSKSIPARNKQKEPYDGCNYTLVKAIGLLKTSLLFYKKFSLRPNKLHSEKL